jgi:hypothetical protein
MKADNRYDADYSVVSSLILLLSRSDANQHEQFAEGLSSFWAAVRNSIPEGLRDTPCTCVLQLYFQYHGDLRKAIADCEALLVSKVGYEAHRERMDHVRGQVGAVGGLFDLLHVLKERKA